MAGQQEHATMQPTGSAKPLERGSGPWSQFAPVLAGLALFALLWVLGSSQDSYPLFHTLAEVFAIVVACTVFVVAWNGRRYMGDDYVLYLGIAFVFVAGVDLLHTLAYKGVGVFYQGDVDRPTQLWLIARLLQASAFVIAPVFLTRRIRSGLVFAAYAAVTALAVVSIVRWHVFPVAFVEGTGLTPFKIVTEYVVSALCLAGLAALAVNRRRFVPKVWRYVAASLVVTVASELAFTLYTDPFGRANMVGHLLKIVAFYLLYKAIVETAVARPFELMFRELAEREGQFRAIFERASMAMVQCSLDGRFVRVNEAMCELVGYSHEELADLSYDDLTVPEDRPTSVANFTGLVDGTVAGYSSEKRYTHKDGSTRWVHLTVSLVHAADGSPLYVIGLIDDITGRKAAEERISSAKRLDQALNEVNHAINSTLDPQEVLRTVVHATAHAVGAHAAMLLERRDEDWLVRHTYGFSRQAEGKLFPHRPGSLRDEAVRLRGPIVVDDAPSDTRMDPGHTRDTRVRSVLAVPLLRKDEVFAVLHFCDLEQPGRFGQHEIDFATKLTASVGLALANAVLYTDQHHIAETLQESLATLPQAVSGIALGHVYRSASEAARVGGDFYDVFQDGADRVCLVIGDVSGKGVEAAAITAVVKSAMKAHALDGDSPARVVAKTNRLLCRTRSKASFVTAFFGRLDCAAGTLAFCNAGHPAPLLRRAGGTVLPLETDSPLIGAFEGLEYREESVRIEPGDLLVAFTDGVTEARRGDDFYGDERLTALLAGLGGTGPDAAAKAVVRAVEEFTGGALYDDTAILALSLDDTGTCEMTA